MRYSIFRLVREALSGHRGWTPMWRDASPKPDYGIVIVGGGGHGLATAYYLAAKHGITDVAVVEKNWIGSGNAGRNTTIIRSNYLLPGNEQFYEWSMRLWEGLERELNYNVMVSQKGVLNLCHTDGQRDAFARRGNAMRLHGAGAELLDLQAVRRRLPFLDFDNARFPIQGGLLQPRGGTARHDAVVWGYARAASALGVDIIQGCEVTGFLRDRGNIVGVETTRGPIRSRKVGVAVAGNTSRVVALAGLRVPIESHILQAFVSEAVKPFMTGVVTFGAGHFYVSQSENGTLVFGGDIEGYNSYAQRGNLPGVEDADADDRPAARPALVGRNRRHVDGRLALHRPHADRRAVPERRLELRRIQGDARVGLVLRTSARARRDASAGSSFPSGPFRNGPRARRKRTGRHPEPALSQCAFPVPSAASVNRANSRASATLRPRVPTPRRPMRWRTSSTRSTCVTTRPASTKNCGTTDRAVAAGCA